MGPINWHWIFFLLFSLMACGFAVAVVVSANIVRMAFYLIVSLGATAGLFFLAGADFVGAMQLLIYVGGTLVLLIFGVMLTAQAPFISMKTSGGDWVLAIMLSGLFMLVLVPVLFAVPGWRNEPSVASTEVAHGAAEAPHSTSGEHAGAAADAAARTPPIQRDTATPLGMGLMGVRVDKLEDRPEQLKSGMSGYLFPFEAVSVHLLVVLIGAAYLARTKRRARSSE